MVNGSVKATEELNLCCRIVVQNSHMSQDFLKSSAIIWNGQQNHLRKASAELHKLSEGPRATKAVTKTDAC